MTQLPNNAGNEMLPAPSSLPENERDPALIARWRLVLGRSAQACGLGFGGNADAERIDALLGFLHEGGDQTARGGTGRSGGQGPGRALNVPEWIEQVNELFPAQAKEVLERELIQKRGIAELLEQPDLLEKIEPNMDLVKTLLTHKDLLNPKARILARKIIDKVVQELKEKLKIQVEQTIIGAIRKDKHSPRKVFRNLDLKTTLRRNLHNYDGKTGKLLIERAWYYAAERNKRPWHIIVTVDQSGSMLDSAIFSAVMASIFAELPAVRTSLVLFDTEVVDLSGQVGQPVDVLLQIQLGGGTDITKALQYSYQLVREPARSIVVLITDFYEGRDERDLIRQTKTMAESGVRMVGLGALGYDARPAYNKSTAGKLRKSGMDILVCTPEKLAECMARIIRGR
jgi:Mg-chelatase subunit ChlD